MNNNTIKIGKSNNPYKRIKQLQTGNSDKLMMLNIISGDLKEEKELHRKFINVSNEWFSAKDKSLLLFINANNTLGNYVELINNQLMVYKKIECA